LRSWRPICAPRSRWSSPRLPPRARRSSTASITSTAATSGSRRSSPPAAPRSSGSATARKDDMAGPLKLRAEDEEDLAVVSAILQDALVPIGEMAYLPEEQRFVLVANRF